MGDRVLFVVGRNFLGALEHVTRTMESLASLVAVERHH